MSKRNRHSPPAGQAAPEAQAVTADQAKAAIIKEQQERARRCQDEINAVLERYRCTLDVAVVLRPPGQVIPQVAVVPKE